MKSTPWVHFIKVKHQFWRLKRFFFWRLKRLFFGVINANINYKHITFWRFKRQNYFMKFAKS